MLQYIFPSTANHYLPSNTYYCNGRQKPTWRGWLHLGTFLFLPFAATQILLHSKSLCQIGCSVIYIISNGICYGSSALWHRMNWQLHHEIWIHRLDMGGIFFMIAGSYTPSLVLLLDDPFPPMLLCWSLCIGGAYITMFRHFTLLCHLSVFCSVTPFVPLLFTNMTIYEIQLTCATWISYGIGTIIFSFQYPDPFPNSFGYHEIFHVFVVLASIFAYCVNLSIIERT